MGKGNRTFFKLGDYNAICRVCGFKRKASEMRLRWDGVYVCEQDWEIRQPQDFVRGLPEEVAPEWTQPEPPPVFLPLGKLGTGAGPAILGGTANPGDGTATKGVEYGNLIIGVPAIYKNGTLLTSGVDYQLTTSFGNITFTVAPHANDFLTWSGTWKDNALVLFTIVQFRFAVGDGHTTSFIIYAAV
jgi:hypothetical protein